MVYLKSRESFGECYSVFDEDTGNEEGIFFFLCEAEQKEKRHKKEKEIIKDVCVCVCNDIQRT